MKPRCVQCGRPAKDQHHLTLRDSRGARLDDDLTAPLCRAHHQAAHNTLRILDLERAQNARWGVERIELRLRRVAVFVAAMAPTWGPLCLVLAAALTRWADELHQHGAALDLRDPGWREVEGTS